MRERERERERDRERKDRERDAHRPKVQKMSKSPNHWTLKICYG